MMIKSLSWIQLHNYKLSLKPSLMVLPFSLVLFWFRFKLPLFFQFLFCKIKIILLFSIFSSCQGFKYCWLKSIVLGLGHGAELSRSFLFNHEFCCTDNLSLILETYFETCVYSVLSSNQLQLQLLHRTPLLHVNWRINI